MPRQNSSIFSFTRKSENSPSPAIMGRLFGITFPFYRLLSCLSKGKMNDGLVSFVLVLITSHRSVNYISDTWLTQGISFPFSPWLLLFVALEGFPYPESKLIRSSNFKKSGLSQVTMQISWHFKPSRH